MIPISNRTKNLVDILYQSENERERIKSLLVNQLGDNIPFCENSTPETMERIRFSVLKLTLEKGDFDRWVKLASTDWRDLFMVAGFGEDTKAHYNWAEKLLNEK